MKFGTRLLQTASEERRAPPEFPFGGMDTPAAEGAQRAAILAERIVKQNELRRLRYRTERDIVLKHFPKR